MIACDIGKQANRFMRHGQRPLYSVLSGSVFADADKIANDKSMTGVRRVG
jgi:hypothetical protein